MKKIDTHQHLLYPDNFTYSWVKDFALEEVLGGAFPLEEYKKLAEPAGISGSLFMEVDVDEVEQGEEARFFSSLSEDPANGIVGVIASGRPEKENFSDYLDSISHPSLKAIRRMFHTLTELPINDTFIRNIRLLGERNLAFDICALPAQMETMSHLVENCPDTQFVLDHCGNPAIASGELVEWREAVKKMAAHKNLTCKVSGIIASCEPGKANVGSVQSVFDHVLEQFGPDRLIFGGDWPVCNLTSSLDDWVSIATELVASLNREEQENFWSGNASRVYDWCFAREVLPTLPSSPRKHEALSSTSRFA